ncbi:MAG: isoaspartyl peptidase/L-asparaginase [Candidatus Hodarchaeota archaeon]
MEYGLVIHGGAWAIPDEAVSDHLIGMKKAVDLGFPMLEKGGSALDVVEAVVAYLEDNPTYDAGRGSFLNSIGEVEMDAIIATDDYQLGSVAAIQNIRNPVKVARRLLDTKGPVFLTGKGANLFASEMGFATCLPEDLLVGRELERYYELKKKKDFVPKDAFRHPNRGTVGAVVLDKRKRLAVAVSTGGTPKKAPGRVGDSPLFGAGAYLEKNVIGVAATGYGEDLIRILMSKLTVELFKTGNSPQKATELAINYLGTSVNGLGGIIALGTAGIGIAWNTPRMAFGFQTDSHPKQVGIEKEDYPFKLL